MAESKSRKLNLRGFSTKGLAGDLSAGLTKSIDSVTGGMANAVLAGVNPVYGLYTVLAATPIGALFTSSVFMNIDSTGALAATTGSMLAFAYSESETTTIVELVFQEGGIPITQPAPAALPSNKVTVLYAYGSLFFAGARNLEEDLPQADETQHAVVILNLHGHTELGSTFIGVLERYAQTLQANGNTLMLVGVSQPIYEQLKNTGFLAVIGEGNVFLFSKLGEATRQAYEKAQQVIQARSIRTQSVAGDNENSNG